MIEGIEAHRQTQLLHHRLVHGGVDVGEENAPSLWQPLDGLTKMIHTLRCKYQQQLEPLQQTNGSDGSAAVRPSPAAVQHTLDRMCRARDTYLWAVSVLPATPDGGAEQPNGGSAGGAAGDGTDSTRCTKPTATANSAANTAAAPPSSSSSSPAAEVSLLGKALFCTLIIGSGYIVAEYCHTHYSIYGDDQLDDDGWRFEL